MACLPLTVDAETLERAQLQAAISGVAIKDVVRQALHQFAASAPAGPTDADHRAQTNADRHPR